MSNTELTRNLPAPLRPVERLVAPLLMQSAEMGSLPTLRADADPSVVGGQYYGPGNRGQQRGHPVAVTSNRQSHDQELQRRLWQVSEELTGVRFPV